MEKVITIIFVVSIGIMMMAIVRGFSLQPAEVIYSGNEIEYAENHLNATEVYNKRWSKNWLMLKISLTTTVLSGILLFILTSI